MESASRRLNNLNSKRLIAQTISEVTARIRSSFETNLLTRLSFNFPKFIVRMMFAFAEWYAAGRRLTDQYKRRMMLSNRFSVAKQAFTCKYSRGDFLLFKYWWEINFQNIYTRKHLAASSQRRGPSLVCSVLFFSLAHQILVLSRLKMITSEGFTKKNVLEILFSLFCHRSCVEI